MARPIRRFEIYLPLKDNDGRPFPERKFSRVEDEPRYGGITATRSQFPLRGIWRSGDVLYYDDIVILSAYDFTASTSEQLGEYLARLKVRLKKQFRQLELLITIQELQAI